jgi:hypothetical protein
MALQTLEVSLAEVNDTGTSLDTRLATAQRAKIFANQIGHPVSRGARSVSADFAPSADALGGATTLSAKLGPAWITSTYRRHYKALLWVVKKAWGGSHQLG